MNVWILTFFFVTGWQPVNKPLQIFTTLQSCNQDGRRFIASVKSQIPDSQEILFECQRARLTQS